MNRPDGFVNPPKKKQPKPRRPRAVVDVAPQPRVHRLELVVDADSIDVLAGVLREIAQGALIEGLPIERASHEAASSYTLRHTTVLEVSV